MFRFLKSLFSAGAPEPQEADPWHTLESLLAPTAAWSDAQSGPVRGALRRLAASSHDAARVTALLEGWYAGHPIEVVWRSQYDLVAEDPLHVEISDVVASADDPALAPWARLLRSLRIIDGGAEVFHHGLTAGELLGVLRDPNAPTVEVFRASSLVNWKSHELDAVIGHLTHDATMRRLRHLGLGVSWVEPRHVARFLGSGRAANLVSLDLCERLLDRANDQVLAALGAMSGLRSLEHLNMYNNIRTSEHMRALAAHQFPRLTHLSLGHATVDDEFVDALCTSDAFPALRALFLQPCPPALARWMEARGIARTLH